MTITNTGFIEFLAKSGAIRFGDFTLKSGRKSPYFIDLGAVNSGVGTMEMGKAYALKLKESFGPDFDVVFGPAYKAIPLSISTAMALTALGMNKKWLFDRKEIKIHGADANSIFVGGGNLDHNLRIVILDDVITTGGTKIEAIEKLEKALRAEVVGVVIAVDRMEIGMRKSALDEFKDKSGVPVFAITDIFSIFTHLKGKKINDRVYVNEESYESFKTYMNKYGVGVKF